MIELNERCLGPPGPGALAPATPPPLGGPVYDVADPIKTATAAEASGFC